MSRFQYGGQAVLEGVMMRGKHSMAIAVRRPDGDISVKVNTISSSSRMGFLKWPFIRGVVNLIDSLVIGMNALMYSANEVTGDDEQLSPAEMTLTLVMGLGLFILLFIVVPNIAAGFIQRNVSNIVVVNLLEGLFRIVIFIVYLLAVSKMKDIDRVFQYHGAEHKTISTWEAGEEIRVSNAMKYSTLHPRCGTNFLLIVMIISILIFSFLGRQTVLMRILSRVLLLPVVAGVSYEFLKFAGSHDDNPIIRCAIWPGLMLQKLTTRQPDPSQLEVAIVSLKAAMERDDAIEAGENMPLVTTRVVTVSEDGSIEPVERKVEEPEEEPCDATEPFGPATAEDEPEAVVENSLDKTAANAVGEH